MIAGGRHLFALALLVCSPARADADIDTLVKAAISQVGVTRTYDPAYVQLDYPGGDIALDRGVCSDVVIRAMRALGVDLQVKVHEDMSTHFSAYPKRWGLKHPDSNIDHRRVPNLETWLSRNGKRIPSTANPVDYRPGDFVSWRLDEGQPHIGIVADLHSADGLRPLIIHNIGAGTRIEDVLFAWTISGHYRWFSQSTSF